MLRGRKHDFSFSLYKLAHTDTHSACTFGFVHEEYKRTATRTHDGDGNIPYRICNLFAESLGILLNKIFLALFGPIYEFEIASKNVTSNLSTVNCHQVIIITSSMVFSSQICGGDGGGGGGCGDNEHRQKFLKYDDNQFEVRLCMFSITIQYTQLCLFGDFVECVECATMLCVLCVVCKLCDIVLTATLYVTRGHVKF